TLHLLTPLAAKKNVNLRLMSPDAPALAEVDAGLFQQVLTNLVMNAIQAMAKPGDVEVAIVIELVRPPAEHGGPHTKYLRVTVRDAGIGMTSEQMQPIFEPFYTTKPVGDGTGLGLSVAYGIVRDHGGWIAVESEPGRGSEFSMYLPRGDER